MPNFFFHCSTIQVILFICPIISKTVEYNIDSVDSLFRFLNEDQFYESSAAVNLLVDLDFKGERYNTSVIGREFRGLFDGNFHKLLNLQISTCFF